MKFNRRMAACIFFLILVSFTVFPFISTSEIQQSEQGETFQSSEGLSESPWPAFGRDRKNTGRSPYNTEHVDGTEKWCYDVDDTFADVRSSPAIGADGTIYVGSWDDNLHAINPNGTEKWIFETNGSVNSSPTIDKEGTIYIGSNDNNVYAIHPNGTEKWRFKTDGLVESSPIISDDGTIYVGSYDNHLYAINPDGTEKWSFDTGRSVSSHPAIADDGTIYLSDGYSWDKNFYAVYPNGTEKWAADIDSSVEASPAIDQDGIVYFVSDDAFYAFNPNGAEKWIYEKWSYSDYTSPSVGYDGTIYIGHGPDLYAMNPNGTEKWNLRIGRRLRSSPAISGEGMIYVGGTNSNLHAVNPNGTEKWVFETGYWIQSSPAVGEDGTIYVGSDDGHLYAIGWQKPEISNQSPAKGSTDVPIDTTLSVEVSGKIHPLEVEFYLNNTVVYKETVDEDCLVETEQLNLEYYTNYQWQVVVTDGKGQTVSSSHSFQTIKGIYFDIQITSPLHIDEFVQGDVVTVEYNVENIGTIEGSRDVNFEVDSEETDIHPNLNLEPNESYQGQFTWETDNLPAENYNLAVSSEHNFDRVSVTLLRAPCFEVDIIRYDDNVTEGEEVIVEYKVINRGDVGGEQRIELIIVNERGETIYEYSTVLRLESLESYNGDLRWESEGDGEMKLKLRSVHGDEVIDTSEEVSVHVEGKGIPIYVWILVGAVLFSIGYMTMFYHKNKKN